MKRRKLIHNFSKDNSETSNCNICGKLCKLSKDHVFPKGLLSFEDGAIDNLHFFQRQETSLSPKNKGVFFRTICGKCNNFLGGNYDQALIDVVVSARKQLTHIQNLNAMSFMFPEYSVSLEATPSNICRGVIGHLLSARISFDGPMMDDMRNYVLNQDAVLPKKYHLYTWLFPKEEYSVSAECCIADTQLQHSTYDCYKVYPLAFLFADIDWNMPGVVDLLTYPHGNSTTVKYDCLNHPHPDWPESGLNLPEGFFRLFGANMYNALKYVRRQHL
mgnify:CR=1 FL=1